MIDPPLQAAEKRKQNKVGDAFSTWNSTEEHPVPPWAWAVSALFLLPPGPTRRIAHDRCPQILVKWIN